MLNQMNKYTFLADKYFTIRYVLFNYAQKA